MNTTARDLAREVLAAEMEPEALELADAAEEAGARWVFDPEVEGVVGLIRGGNRALAIVYLNVRDAEFSDELFDGMYA